MATDPVLALHRARPRRYELSSLRTGSIRDQVIRATLIVDRLIKDGEIVAGADGRGLLIVGAGAAGISACLAAAVRGVNVEIVEKFKPLALQKTVSTRWIDPTEFDFPQLHWRAGRVPFRTNGGVPLPLTFEARNADDLARLWLTLFRKIANTLAGKGSIGKIALHQGLVDASQVTARYNNPQKKDKVIGISWSRPSGTQLQFGAVLACIGLGDENVSVGGYRGYKFWSPDRLGELTSSAFAVPAAPLRVLVSGGGDGAQQDFLRAATGGFGKALYLRLGLQQDYIPLALLLQAEDDCRRSHAWLEENSPHREALYRRWERPYLAVADKIWRKWSRQPGRIQALCANVLLNVSVCWIIREERPGHCYSLNRLLCLLIARLHARHTGRRWHANYDRSHGDYEKLAVIQPSCTINSVIAAAPFHRCGNPDHCFNKAHKVVLSQDPSSTEDFDLIVVRHGIAGRPSLFGGAAVTEQLPPYGLE